MTDKEKLVELLNNSFAEQHEKRGLLTALHTATDLIAHGVTVQEWISVKDRLPEPGERVIVARGEKVEQGVYLAVNGWWKVYGTNTKSVTHWMPLPEPPKEDKT